jgi:hypothetical protein
VPTGLRRGAGARNTAFGVSRVIVIGS